MNIAKKRKMNFLFSLVVRIASNFLIGLKFSSQSLSAKNFEQCSNKKVTTKNEILDL